MESLDDLPGQWSFSEPDLALVARIAASRTGTDVQVAGDVLDAAWGILRGKVEWEITNARVEGYKLGAKVGYQLSSDEAPQGLTN